MLRNEKINFPRSNIFLWSERRGGLVTAVVCFITKGRLTLTGPNHLFFSSRFVKWLLTPPNPRLNICVVDFSKGRLESV